jgi:hypothetical protein
LVRARTASEARRPFAGLTELGAGLGDAIGASARIRPPSALGTQRGFWKAVGAGNEVGVFIALGDRRRHEHETTDLRVSRDGILWS